MTRLIEKVLVKDPAKLYGVEQWQPRLSRRAARSQRATHVGRSHLRTGDDTVERQLLLPPLPS